MHAIKNFFKDRPILSVLLLSGSLGFVFGLTKASWQVSAQTAQVLCGLVRYPPDNANYIYQMKAFSLLNQITALLLYFIRSEKIVSILISGLLGMVSFQALALTIFAINRDVFLSFLGVTFIYFLDYTGQGVNYPIHLLGVRHTMGIIGLSLSVLIMALLGTRSYRAGLFLLGLLFSVHITWGGWLFMVIFLSACFEWEFAKQILKTHYAYLLAGILVSAVSLIYQLHLMQDLPVIEAEVRRHHFLNFIKHWDAHRVKFYWNYRRDILDVMKPGIMVGIYTTFISLMSLKFFKGIKPLSFILRMLAISGILSLLAGALTHWPLEYQPDPLIIFMPGRFINFNNIVCGALLLGLWTAPPLQRYRTNYCLFLAVVLINILSPSPNNKIVGLSFATLFVWLFYLTYLAQPVHNKIRGIINDAGLSFSRMPGFMHKCFFWAGRLRRFGYAKTFACLLALFLLFRLPDHDFRDRYFKRTNLKDGTDLTLLKRIAQRKGLLLITKEFHYIQLQTRRPTLIDPGNLDNMVYAPESCLIVDNILKKVYGVDLFLPPDTTAWIKGCIESSAYKHLWEKRSLSDWQEISKEFGIKDVLTPSGWDLDLPIVLNYRFRSDPSQGVMLFNIPDKGRKEGIGGD